MAFEIFCMSEATSPITHMSGSVGNESIVSREAVKSERGVVYVPCLSGNALRHRCVRLPGMLWLIDRYGLKGKLTLPVLNLLLHGGNLTMSTAMENTKRIAEMYEVFPLLGLLGGSLPDQILAGSLDVMRGVLVCEENRARLTPDFGAIVPQSRMLSAQRFVDGYKYTRQDAAKLGMVDAGEVKDSNLMIFAGQSVIPGSVFMHGFTIKRDRPLLFGALLHSLTLWQAQGGTIGGQSARGHGRLSTTVFGLDPSEVVNLVAEYEEFAISMKDSVITWIESAFAEKSKKPTKKGGKEIATTELEGGGNA